MSCLHRSSHVVEGPVRIRSRDTNKEKPSRFLKRGIRNRVASEI
jgi:hypothetical protein